MHHLLGFARREARNMMRHGKIMKNVEFPVRQAANACTVVIVNATSILFFHPAQYEKSAEDTSATIASGAIVIKLMPLL